jgi:hypothetical protein
MQTRGRWLGASMAKLNEWHRANPAVELEATVKLHVRPQDVRCDECGETANWIHFIRNERNEEVAVKFSCSDHDFGGYGLAMPRFGNPDERLAHHVAGKRWGLHGLAALQDRLEEIKTERMIEEGVVDVK